MSKSVGKVFGTSSVDKMGYEKNYLNYLNNYDTSNYDDTLENLTSYAKSLSGDLSQMPGYQFSIDGSDEARRRAENATYNSYLDKLTPQYQQQTADLETSLINKGLAVGSEAYQRAMGDLQEKQNEALNQAAYQSVLNGQNAYSTSLNDSIQSAQFSNNAQSNYIDMIKSMLEGSISGYEHQANLYNVNAGIASRIAQAKKEAMDNFKSFTKDAALTAAGFMTGGPAGAVAAYGTGKLMKDKD